jgi:hypothetical protein
MPKHRNSLALACAGFVCTFGMIGCAAEVEVTPEPGSAEMPIRYIGPPPPDLDRPDGGLRPAVGVQSYQVLRASPKLPHLQEDYGYAYNHQPMLAYWKGKFYLEYLSAPDEEYQDPCHTVLATSEDGRTWNKPVVVFPAFELPDGTQTLAHQRMGFYVAPDGRLLVLAFYGTGTGPNDGKGVGRAVREVHDDGSFGPIHFIRYNRHAGWDETNTPYPFYRRSDDRGFVEACDALLADKLMTLQWWEEDRSEDGFYALAGAKKYSSGTREPRFSGKALSFWHRPDGKAVGIWKGAWTALSEDEGASWSTPVLAQNIAKTNAKHWGQRLDNGRYALAYCPQDGWGNRWPLAVVTSDDGITFDDMLSVHGDIPIRRYPGANKNLGAQYVRGIGEGNGDPPGDDLWLTYSVNKEDMWVSRVPVPIRSSVDTPVDDDFDDLTTGETVPDWNIYSPRWAPVSVEGFPSAANKSLRLEDRDPYDYARAIRVFPESRHVAVGFRVLAGQTDRGPLEIEVLDARGRRPVRVILTGDGRIPVGTRATAGRSEATASGPKEAEATEVGTYRPDEWMSFRIEADMTKGTFTLALDDEKPSGPLPLAEEAGSVERLSFRTGEYQPVQLELHRRWEAGGIDPNTDHPIDAAVFYVDEVRTQARAGS